MYPVPYSLLYSFPPGRRKGCNFCVCGWEERRFGFLLTLIGYQLLRPDSRTNGAGSNVYYLVARDTTIWWAGLSKYILLPLPSEGGVIRIFPWMEKHIVSPSHTSWFAFRRNMHPVFRPSASSLSMDWQTTRFLFRCCVNIDIVLSWCFGLSSNVDPSAWRFLYFLPFLFLLEQMMIR